MQPINGLDCVLYFLHIFINYHIELFFSNMHSNNSHQTLHPTCLRLLLPNICCSQLDYFCRRCRYTCGQTKLIITKHERSKLVFDRVCRENSQTSTRPNPDTKLPQTFCILIHVYSIQGKQSKLVTGTADSRAKLRTAGQTGGPSAPECCRRVGRSNGADLQWTCSMILPCPRSHPPLFPCPQNPT